MDLLSLQMIHKRKLTDTDVQGVKIIILNMFSISFLQETSLKHAFALHLGFLPLRIFIGFNIANRWGL